MRRSLCGEAIERAADVDVVAEHVADRALRRGAGRSRRATGSRCGPSCSRRRSRRCRPGRCRPPPPSEDVRAPPPARAGCRASRRSRRRPGRTGSRRGHRSARQGRGRSRWGSSARRRGRAAHRAGERCTSSRRGGPEEAGDLTGVPAVADRDDDPVRAGGARGSRAALRATAARCDSGSGAGWLTIASVRLERVA